MLDILWLSNKTHLQLVERSDKVYKLLLDEKLLNDELLQKLWDLSRQLYKSEVYKIINDNSYQLKQPHKEFLYNQITQSQVQKLDMADFELLEKIGRTETDTNFKAKVSEFFWGIIVDSD